MKTGTTDANIVANPRKRQRTCSKSKAAATAEPDPAGSTSECGDAKIQKKVGEDQNTCAICL